MMAPATHGTGIEVNKIVVPPERLLQWLAQNFDLPIFERATR
jgi:hypothetical protein